MPSLQKTPLHKPPFSQNGMRWVFFGIPSLVGVYSFTCGLGFSWVMDASGGTMNEGGLLSGFLLLISGLAVAALVFAAITAVMSLLRKNHTQFECRLALVANSVMILITICAWYFLLLYRED